MQLRTRPMKKAKGNNTAAVPKIKIMKKNTKKNTPPKQRRAKNNTSSPVEAEAEAIRLSLNDYDRTFIKIMSRSHVVKGFWLGLPASFCRAMLPVSENTGSNTTKERRTNIELVAEKGGVWTTTYIHDKKALSGGWVGFVKDQKLKLGDAVLFHLVEETKFKVYIVPAPDSQDGPDTSSGDAGKKSNKRTRKTCT